MHGQTIYPFRGNKDHLKALFYQVERSAGSLTRLVLLMATLVCTACNLPSQTGGQTPPPGTSGANQTVTPKPGITPSGPTLAPANRSDVRAVARQVYDQAQAGQDLKPLLGGIFEGLGIPVLSESTDGQKGVAMIKAGKPAVFDVQLEMIAQGFANGMAINLDSFMADLTDHGVEAASTPGPLTSAYLKAAMLGLVGKTSYSPQETLPALVIALGQEHARRLGLTAADPVWGNGWLDPLQYALLAYGFSFPGIHSVAGVKPANPTANADMLTWVKKGLDQTSPGFFDDLLKNLKPWNYADYVICGLYTIDKSQIVMVGPQAVYHKQSDVGSPPPYQATITASLLISAPSPTQRDLLILAGCTIPGAGPLPNKTISWSLDSVAQQHGSFTKSDTKTQTDGTVTAIYQTIEETTPQAARMPLTMQKAQGVIQAEVLDLVDGHPKLEAAGRLAGGGKTGLYYLEIRFYSNLVLDIGGTIRLSSQDTTITHVIANQTIPLTGSSGALQGTGSLQVSSSATLDCGSGGVIQGKGTYTGKFQVIATPGSGANNDQLSFSFVPDLSMIKGPVLNSQCTAGDLNFEAWGMLVQLITVTFTLNSSTLTYAYNPPNATSTITFTLHAVKP
jgi:hypothetical protein